MAIKNLKGANIKGKAVLVRVNVDVPLDGGVVADNFRLVSLIPTIEYLLKQKCKVILFGHLGRPQGGWNEKYSLRPVAQRLAELLKLKFYRTDCEFPQSAVNQLVFCNGDLNQEKVRNSIAEALPHNIILLENIRFYKENDENNSFFAKKLAGLADAYVNESFAMDHRKEASVVAITKYLPAYAGIQLEREMQLLDRVMQQPKHPFVVMMGGAKISDKIKTLNHLGKKADTLLIAGGLANLFFASKGYEIGKSKAEHDSVKLAWQMDKNFKGKIILPLDVVVANAKLEKSSIRTCAPHEVKKNELILDAGPKTILAFAKVLKAAKTIVWNGPLGFFETKPFHHSTMALARIVGSVGKGRAYTVVGGGETVDAVRQAHQADYIDHLSTGGGATLEYLAGTKLPGIEALK